MGRRVLLIKAKDAKELDKRIVDSLKRPGTKLIQQGVNHTPIQSVHWARIEYEWRDR